MANKITRRQFTVEGSGQFPYDMLRYDHCWPYSELNDSPSLAQDWASGNRRVVLATDNPHAPTDGRWQSFNWRVVARCELRE